MQDARQVPVLKMARHTPATVTTSLKMAQGDVWRRIQSKKVFNNVTALSELNHLRDGTSYGETPIEAVVAVTRACESVKSLTVNGMQRRCQKRP